MSHLLSAAAAGTACTIAIVLTACASGGPTSSTSAALSTQQATVSATSSSGATPGKSATASPAVTASTAASPVTDGCVVASRPADFAYQGSPANSVTICPGRAAVGDVVHITIQGCDISSQPAAALVFLGPSDFIGSGGGGVEIPFLPARGERATATFTIPASYTGGEHGTAPNPALPVKPGGGYAFATYPAGVCSVPFTVTSGAQ